MGILDLLADANVRWVVGGTLLLGVSSGMLGSFAMLRRRSLMGDVLAHTALPGVAAAFMITQTKSVAPLLVGAVVAGLIASWCVDTITRYSRIKEDTAQGLVLSVFFGAGIVMLTQIAQSGAAGQAGLNRFLFGQAASLVGGDVQVIGLSALVLTVLIALGFKEFKLLAFDPGFGEGMGFNMRAIDRVLMLMIVVGVAIGLQSVGVVLMASLLVTPAAAARYWTDRLDVMVLLAGLSGGLSGVTGTAVSLLGPRLATGPLIVLCATLFFVVSVVFGRREGLLRKLLRHLRTRRRIQLENVLRAAYEEYERNSGYPGVHAGAEAFDLKPIPETHLAEILGWSRSHCRRVLRVAKRRGWLEFLDAPHVVRESAVKVYRAGSRPADAGRFVRLTTAGLAQAQQVTRRHRLWEMYLMYEADFAVDHVDRDADDIEHHLPPDVVAELERRLATRHVEAVIPPSVHPL